MSFEQQYYENADLWTDDVFAGEAERFKLLCDNIPADVRTLLDVGCGNGAFVHLLSSLDRKLDEIHATDRSSAALARVRVPSTQASIDDLPFDDRSYDIVSCLEVVEHLPEPVYLKALSELARVSRKYIMLGVPNEEDIEGAHIQCPSCRSMFHPNFHMRSFSKSNLDTLFSSHGFRAIDFFYAGAMKTYPIVSSILEQRARRMRKGNPSWAVVPCPVCGHELPPTRDAPKAGAPTEHQAKSWGIASAPAALAKAILPTGVSYGWIVALYERQD